MKYIIQDREAGNYIDEFDTLEEAQDTLELFEYEDKEDGTYTENFYEIVEIKDGLKIIDEMDVGNICLEGLSELAEYEINSPDRAKLSIIEDERWNEIYYLYEIDGCVGNHCDIEEFKNIEELNQKFEKEAREAYADYLHDIEIHDGDIDEALFKEQKEEFFKLKELIEGEI